VELTLKKALRAQPRTISALAQEIGDNWRTRKTIIDAYRTGQITLKPTNATNLLILSQTLLVVIEFLPPSIRGVSALFVLFGIPYLWDMVLINLLKFDKNYIILLVIFELILIAFLLGYSGYFSQTAIAVSLFLTSLLKWGIVTYFRNS
jgi:hypothetical protein